MGQIKLSVLKITRTTLYKDGNVGREETVSVTKRRNDGLTEDYTLFSFPSANKNKRKSRSLALSVVPFLVKLMESFQNINLSSMKGNEGSLN